MTDEELLAELKAASRREAPPPLLEERVLQEVADRKRLMAPVVAKYRRRAGIAWLTSAAAAAATLALWVRGAPPAPISPEPTKSAAGAAPSPLPSAAPVVVDPCRARVAARGEAALIDDFEDGDDMLAPLEGRAGFWRWARENDAPGTAPALLPVPRPGGRPGNRLALHVKGNRLFDWGATVEVSFNPPCYDATSYRGIAVSARGPGRIYVSLREVSVIPPFEGGTCLRDCYNGHVEKLELSSGFRSYEVSWEALRQRGIGTPPFDPSRVHSVAFLIRAEDTPYDVWLDDVRFLPRTER